MLGTLAIMGILSMAGIWAYNTAMDKLKANTIINEAQKRAVVIAGQIGLMGSTHPTLGEFKENTFGGGTFSTNVTTEGLYKQFGIQVSGVSKRICQNILNSIDNGTPIRRLTHTGDPQTAIATCEENNNLVLIYNNDMSSLGGDTAYAEDTCGCQTVCGVCVTEGGVSTCKGECPATGTCSSTQPCSGECIGCVIPEGETTGTCQTCQRIAYLESTGTQYIETGISGECRWTGSAQSTSRQTTSQCLISSSQDTGRFLASQIMSTYFWGVSRAQASAYSSTSVTQKANFDITFLDNSTTGTVNGQSISMTPLSTLQTWRMFECLGNPATTYPFYGKLFYLSAYQSNTLVRDFIPVHAPFKETGKQNCMYDKITKTLFCNQGTGEDFKTNLD